MACRRYRQAMSVVGAVGAAIAADVELGRERIVASG